MEQNLAKQTLKTLSLAGYGLGECTSDILIQDNVSGFSEPFSYPLKIEIGKSTHECSMTLKMGKGESGQQYFPRIDKLTAQCHCGKVLDRTQIESILNAYFRIKFTRNSV